MSKYGVPKKKTMQKVWGGEKRNANLCGEPTGKVKGKLGAEVRSITPVNKRTAKQGTGNENEPPEKNKKELGVSKQIQTAGEKGPNIKSEGTNKKRSCINEY